MSRMVSVLDWTVNSPELNPIQNLSETVKKVRGTKPKNVDDLNAAMKATWTSITHSEQRHWLMQYFIQK